MRTYEVLDAAICSAAAIERHPLYHIPSRDEADRIAAATGRDAFRIIDARVRALVKAGRIEYRQRRWRLCATPAA